MNHEGTKGTKMDDARHGPIPDRVERVAAEIIDAAIKVHRALGPGLLESVYEACLCYELSKRGIPYRRQVNMPVRYEEVFVETGFELMYWRMNALLPNLSPLRRSSQFMKPSC